MLLSMTGFGTCTVQLPTKKITVDIKSLNSKQCDINCRLPQSLRADELTLRGSVARSLERGKIDINVTVENTDNAAPTRINTAVIAAYKAQIDEAAASLGVPVPDDILSVLLRMPEAMTSAEETDAASDKTMSQALAEATEGAIQAITSYRRAEGAKLEEFFALRIARIRELLAEVPRFEAERIEHIRTRLADGLSKIPAVDYDKGRLEQEMIFYIEKLDVNEEKQRLTQHLDYFIETMLQATPGQGKKLGFIAQEMGREINTLGSKSNQADMQRLVVRMKDELEQIKEQVLNVM